jgi:S-adenosylmethionine:tRNA ribosyltransferase-isomerase
MFRLSSYDYFLPSELIAQTPALKRDNSRLMVLDRKKKILENKYFFDIVNYLRSGDLLILNNSRVIPARLIGHKISPDHKKGAQCEVLLLDQVSTNVWEALVRPGKRLKKGTGISFGHGLLQAKIMDDTDYGGRLVEFFYQGDFFKIIEDIGLVPLPPYISTHKQIDTNHDLAKRYQTLYAQNPGSAAAPTAGLHFSENVFAALHDKGIQKAFVTLHTGLGTFRPIEKSDIREHQMHKEWYEVNKDTIELIRKTRNAGGRVIAVGTTSVRVLETLAEQILSKQDPQTVSSYTEKYIYPAYKFRVVDALITNFHLPKSSLLVLVSAFAGRKFVLDSYREAIKNKYRFFSFGDAMLII